MNNTRRLLEIMARLRHPEEGCPWDLQQDFASLIPYTLEEAYEVADAIERRDIAIDIVGELHRLLVLAEHLDGEAEGLQLLDQHLEATVAANATRLDDADQGRLDLDAREAVVGGSTLAWDALVLATGVSARRLPVPGPGR